MAALRQVQASLLASASLSLRLWVGALTEPDSLLTICTKQFSSEDASSCHINFLLLEGEKTVKEFGLIFSCLSIRGVSFWHESTGRGAPRWLRVWLCAQKGGCFPSPSVPPPVQALARSLSKINTWIFKKEERKLLAKITSENKRKTAGFKYVRKIDVRKEFLFKTFEI